MNQILDEIDSIYIEYHGIVLSDLKLKEKEFEKRMIYYLYQLSNTYHGTIDYSIPGVVFVTFNKNGLKPLNKYNFYFESGIFRCNNQINFHQKYSSFEITEINDATIYDTIHDFIMNIPLEKNSIESSNPF